MKFVLQLQEVNNEHEDVDTWVHHIIFNSLEEANDSGLEFCKEHEENLKENGLQYAYDSTVMYVIEEGKAYFLCSYQVFPVMTEEEYTDDYSGIID